jgi:2-polyprenyl-3-methyl-5-hydroxy-6-metoxy-1,4-benzoquinol methylase
VSRTGAATPGLWDALRGASVRRELDEWLDRPVADPELLAGNLRDLRRLNRVLGWSAAVCREVEMLMRRRGLRTATVLDVATGSADIPRALLAHAGRRGLGLRVVASDVSAQVLAAAQATGAVAAGVVLVRHDATSLPFRAGAADIALCCLAAHHFAPRALVRLLAELWRVAGHAVVVSDLARGRAGYLAARALALVLRNPLTAHDGPVSVLRAYTPAELRALAWRAGLQRVRVRTVFPARLMLTAERE